MNICVIGNSHTAAIKQAWMKAPSGWAKDVTLTFFAGKATFLRHLALEDGALVALHDELAAVLRLTSGGLDRIELGAYDAFVLVGLGFRFSIPALCDNLGTAAHLRWGPADGLVSASLFAAMIEADIRDNMALSVLSWIRTGSDKPVVICPTPYRIDYDLAESYLERNARVADPDYCGAVMAEVERVGDAVAAEHDATVVWQNGETVVRPGFTRPEFAQGALKLCEGATQAITSDGFHMNADYGRIMLARVLAALGVELSEKKLARQAKRQQKEERKREKRERRAQEASTMADAHE